MILTDYDMNVELQKIANRAAEQAAEQVTKRVSILEVFTSAKDFGKTDVEAIKYASKKHNVSIKEVKSIIS